MDDALLQAALALFNERMERLSRMYFKRMGEHIRHVGALLPSDTNRLIEMRRMNLNLGAVQRAIERELRDDQELTAQVFLKAAQADSDFARALFGAEPASIQRNPALMRLLRAQIRITGGALQNLSQTTVEASGYRALLDEAIQAVTAGLTDYQSAMRATLRAAGTRGLRVTYPSGAVRRLDSAVRQNLLDGARQLSGAILEATGQEFGADGVEISAHPLCAPDHLPYQGRQFSRAEFEALQKALDRPFGQWNCRHVVFPILLGVSAPAHDERELEAYRMNSEETVELAGERKTRYQWTQRQRQIETAVRAQKDLAAAARAAGDDALRRAAQRKILELEAEYERISQAAALELRFERMRVDGFKDLAGRRLAGQKNTEGKNTGDEKPELKKPEKSDIMITGKQLGKKAGKHMIEWGLDPGKEADRQKFVDITKEIYRNADEIRRVEWALDKTTNQRTVEVLAYIKGSDVVLTDVDGKYITTMKDGANNKRVKGGRRIEP